MESRGGRYTLRRARGRHSMRGHGGATRLAGVSAESGAAGCTFMGMAAAAAVVAALDKEEGVGGEGTRSVEPEEERATTRV